MGWNNNTYVNLFGSLSVSCFKRIISHVREHITKTTFLDVGGCEVNNIGYKDCLAMYKQVTFLKVKWLYDYLWEGKKVCVDNVTR